MKKSLLIFFATIFNQLCNSELIIGIPIKINTYMNNAKKSLFGISLSTICRYTSGVMEGKSAPKKHNIINIVTLNLCIFNDSRINCPHLLSFISTYTPTYFYSIWKITDTYVSSENSFLTVCHYLIPLLNAQYQLSPYQ